MSLLEFVLSLCLGVGLAAACGFRVFVPMLGLSLAAMAGHLQLSEGFEWIGSWPALACFAAATTLEVTAYYVPWLDNLLDSIATPAAFVAGTIMVAATLGVAPSDLTVAAGLAEQSGPGDSASAPLVMSISPLLRWSLALIAGGAMAGTIQLGTVGLRGASSVTTGGLGNFLVSSLELIMSILTTLFAFIVPVACVLVVTGSGAMLLGWRQRRSKRTSATKSPAQPALK